MQTTHLTENLLDEIRNGRKEFSEKNLQVLFNACDALGKLLEEASNGNIHAPADAALIRALEIALQRQDTRRFTKSDSKPTNIDTTLVTHDALGPTPAWLLHAIDDTLICDCLFAGGNGNSWGGIYIPGEQNWHQMEERLASVARLTLCRNADVMLFISENTDNTVEKLLEKDVSPQLPQNAGWWLRNTDGTLQHTSTNTSSDEPSSKPQESTPALEDKPPTSVAQTIRVDSDRLDQLLNTAGEMTITKARLNQQIAELQQHLLTGWGNDETSMSQAWKTLCAATAALNDTAQDLHRHTSAVQNGVMRTRMVPIGPLFNRFRRLVRDVSRATEKQAQLALHGETTELDKRLIDELADPLTHLIRNCVDHGLENPQDRLASGKPEQGTITLSAVHSGGSVTISITDDGGGLDADKIAAKAIDRGLVTQSDVTNMLQSDIFNFIFHPGFSTASEVSNISGRGVGMDIVRKSIADLKGSIELDSEKGVGTTFRLTLPLTLSMIDALLVTIGNTRCAFPLDSVKEIIDIPKDGIHHPDGETAIIDLRGHSIVVINPGDALGIRRSSKCPNALCC